MTIEELKELLNSFESCAPPGELRVTCADFNALQDCISSYAREYDLWDIPSVLFYGLLVIVDPDAIPLKEQLDALVGQLNPGQT